MKRYVVYFLSLVMVITMTVTMVMSASAAEFSGSSYSTQDTRVSTPFPFTMIIQSASNDLNTMDNPAKRFTKASISENNITTYGKIILTYVEGRYSAGIGYLNGNLVTGVPDLSVSEQLNNTMFSRSLAVMHLVAGRTYFLYAKNDSISSCTMHGTVSTDVYW